MSKYIGKDYPVSGSMSQTLEQKTKIFEANRKKQDRKRVASDVLSDLIAGAVIIAAFSGVVGSAYLLKTNTDKMSALEKIKNATISSASVVMDVKTGLTDKDFEHYAFLFQSCGISENGAITKPLFFGILSEKIRNDILSIKDLNVALSMSFREYSLSDKRYNQYARMYGVPEKSDTLKIKEFMRSNIR